MFLQLKEPQHQSAILVDANDARREMFQLMLGNRSLFFEACFASIEQALADRSEPDLAMVYIDRAAPADLQDLGRLRASKPSSALLALVEEAEQADIERILDAGADHVLPLGLQSDRFTIATISALAQARKQRRLVADKDRAERALTEAKRVARAKMILIARHGIDEAEAHRRVQKLSMERNLPLADMAAQIIDAESLLC